MATSKRSLLNEERLAQEMESANLDAVVAVSPENTFYLSGCFIRTQISIRERLAFVVWPRQGEPTYIVCNIEESLARGESWIADLRTYVEFAQSPIDALVEVLTERGLATGRVGIEERFLTAAYHQELLAAAPGTAFVRFDEALGRVRAIKTAGEIERIAAAFNKTEEAIRIAWESSRAGDSERQVADRMIEELMRRGADNVRHISFNAGENTVITHRQPGARKLMPGDTVITDFGGNWGGFNSDIARVGVVGEPSAQVLDEYRRYQAAYVESLHFLRPGVTAAEVFNFCKEAFAKRGMTLTGPHFGHSLSRAGGHDEPILHPFNDQPLEPGMLIAFEPVYKVEGADRVYHLEDLVLITEDGCDILSPWERTEEMIRIPG